ncbi:ThuA domain-containing protein [Streptomyces sp. NBC_00038]|uniref:ThuA domain-containing protein n=1 Tax=Streptomyces sp. NBC_00038 TaxID=2903615 RepID=UPI00224D7FEE|nr:ThuA domain-containing protein [Streptomyces sp. NBC_00038]MCX5562552.1 ThuA domain-containing protein [Streptomyces sp. NBC_00038]
MSDRQILVYTATAAYRHASIPAGVAAFRELGAEHGFVVHATEEPLRSLDGYDAVVFLSTSGEVLDEPGRSALLEHVAGGGGFLGVHSAACTEYEWPAYGELLGARFAGHPPVQPAVLTVDRSHPATAHLPRQWHWTDEWYDFRAPPSDVTVLATVDETTYTGGCMGADHPLVWYRHHGRGRSFYTALGHAPEAYADPAFRAHLLGALRCAAAWPEGDVGSPLGVRRSGPPWKCGSGRP